MTEPTQPKTKGLFTRISHKIQKTLRITNKYKKHVDLDDLNTEQICVDDEHTMNKLAQSIQMLDTIVANAVIEDAVIEDTIVEDTIVEYEVVKKPPPKMSKIVRSIKMSNLLLEEDLCSKYESKDTDSTDDSKDTESTINVCLHDLCLQDICLQDEHEHEHEDDACDHEVCFREVTIMNISGANGKKPTYKITNTCRCPRLSLC